MSYAIIWVDDGGNKFTGRLDLTPTAVILTGTGAGATRELSYDELVSARVERWAQVDLPPEPALVVGLQDGERLVIGALEGVGALYELADDLAAARGNGRPYDEPRPVHAAARAAGTLAPQPTRK